MTPVQIHTEIYREIARRAEEAGFSVERYMEYAALAYDPDPDIESFARGEDPLVYAQHRRLTATRRKRRYGTGRMAQTSMGSFTDALEGRDL